MSWPKLGDDVTVFVSAVSYPAVIDHYAFARVTAISAVHFIATIVIDDSVRVDLRGFGVICLPEDEGSHWCFEHSESKRRALEVAHVLSA